MTAYKIELWRNGKIGEQKISDRIASTFVTNKHDLPQELWEFGRNCFQEAGFRYWIQYESEQFITTIHLDMWVEARFKDFRNYFMDYCRYPVREGDKPISRRIPNFGSFRRVLKEGMNNG